MQDKHGKTSQALEHGDMVGFSPLHIKAYINED